MVKSKMFKWNPFILLGEAPASLRFKTEVDDLEFASKEDLEAIKADPKLSKLHQSMTAGVSKKFQSFAEERKALLQKVEMLQAQIAELDAGLTEWEDTYIKHKPEIDAVLTGKGGQPERGKKLKSDEDEGVWEGKFNQLVTAINKAGEGIEKRISKAERMLHLSMQLNDLYRKNPQMDGDKVLDAAIKAGDPDLDRAYQTAYHDDILNQEVDKRLQPRVQEELQKRTTNVETGSGATPLKFEIPKEASKNWTELGQDFLKERAEELAKT